MSFLANVLTHLFIHCNILANAWWVIGASINVDLFIGRFVASYLWNRANFQEINYS